MSHFPFNQNQNNHINLLDPQFQNDMNNISHNFKQLRLRFAKNDKSNIEMSHNDTLSAIESYHSLFSYSNIYEENFHLSAIFDNFTNKFNMRVSAEEQQNLEKEITTSELYSNLKSLISKGSSAPGPDSITYFDWFKSWNYIKDLIYIIANYILRGNLTKGSSISKVFIKLIPKKNHDPKNQDFSIDTVRPISLTNSIFRLINYVITQRLMIPINRIVQFNQQAFLHHRNIHFNIETTKMIAQNLYSTQSPSNQHLLLIDFTKAFDTIDHTFIRKILQHLQFPDMLINSILTQSNSSVAHILNGQHVNNQQIPLLKGVRQGLPFSPLIVIIAIEPL